MCVLSTFKILRDDESKIETRHSTNVLLFHDLRLVEGDGYPARGIARDGIPAHVLKVRLDCPGVDLHL